MSFVDLGTNILAGGNVSGAFTLLTGQKVLSDARNSFINTHSPHDTHLLSGRNESGYSTSYPTIVPYNNGFLSMQQWFYNRPDSDWSPLANVFWRITAMDQNGVMLWEKDASLSDLDVTVWNPTATYTSDIGSFRNAMTIAGNLDSRILYRVDAHHTDGSGAFIDRYFHLDFDGIGNFTRSFAFDVQASPSPGYAYSFLYGPMMRQVRSGTGWVAWANEATWSSSRQTKLFYLTDDLDLVDSPALPAAGSSADTYYQRSVMPGWNGGEGLWLVDHKVPYNSAPTEWTAIQITFDGTNPATYGTAQHGTSAIDNWNAYNPYAARGFLQVNNWDTGAPPEPADVWNPNDGSATFNAPNPNQMEWVYSSDMDNGHYGPTSLIPSTVADWYDRYTGDSPYNGDTFGNNNYVLRLNVGRFDTKVAGFIDLEIKYPLEPTQSFPWGTGYWDTDMDEPAWCTVHPINGRVLILAYHYWTPKGPAVTDGGEDYGQHWLSTFWIGQMEASTVAPPAEMPAWYNAFGSSGSAGGGVAPANPGDCIRLGEGENVVYLYDRGGARQIAKIPDADLTLVRWSRKRDDMSECTIRVTSPGAECCQIVRQMQAGRHELVVFRDGVRVWEGPITRISYMATAVEIEAKDISHYLSRTIMHSAYDNRYRKKGSRIGPITKRLQNIIQREMLRKERLNPSYNVLKFLDVRTNKKTTRTSRYTPAYYSTVWEELDYAAAKLSLDYTVIGRRLVINDVHDVIGRLPQLTDKDFTDELIVTSYGMELATRSAVTDGEGHWAAVGTSADPYYGEVELLNTTYGEEAKPEGTKLTKAELKALQQEMTSQAQRNLAGRYPIPTVVRVPDNTRLSPEAPLKINDLVPGVRVPIRATLACLELEQEQKLDFVQVEQTSAGETISITLSPAPGTTPWDDSSETED